MRAALFAVCGLLAGGSASAADFGGLVFVQGVDRVGRLTEATPPGVDASSRSVEAALLLEGEFGGLDFRLRGEAFADTETGEIDAAAVRLKELSYGRRLSDRWAVSIGLQQRTWGAGTSYQPLGFFRSRVDLADPFDSAGRIEGLPMAVLTRIGERISFEAIVSEPFAAQDEAQRLNGRQAAVKISGDVLSGLNLALIARKRAGADPGVGLSATYVTGNVEVHGDAYFGAPDAEYGFVGFSEPAALRRSPPFALRAGAPARLRTVIGATWTPTPNWTLSLDWVHRSDAPSPRAWSAFVDGVKLHRAALSGPEGGLAFQNLIWDLAAVAAPRRDDLFFMGQRQFGRIGVNASVLLALDDGGVLANAGAIAPLPRRVTLGLAASVFRGPAESRFGLVPIDSAVRISLSRSF